METISLLDTCTNPIMEFVFKGFKSNWLKHIHDDSVVPFELIQFVSATKVLFEGLKGISFTPIVGTSEVNLRGFTVVFVQHY